MTTSENPKPPRPSLQVFHLDLKVGQYRADYLATLFPRLREAGYDSILFEIENKVRLDSIGRAASVDAYSKAEFSVILKNCHQAGLKAIPLVQTYAHLEWLLTHAPFHQLRELPGIAYTLCPLKPESRDFLHRFIDEVLELFEHPAFVHLGGDEATYMGTCPDCRAVVEADGKGTLYGRHMGSMASYALNQGSRPLLWSDMVLGHPECLAHFPKEVIWVDWHYEMTPEGPETTNLWGEPGRPRPSETSETFRQRYGAYAFQASETRYRPWFYADYLLDQGFDVLIAPAASCAGSHAFLPSFERATNVAAAGLKLREEPRLLGQIVTSWAMRLPLLESQWPLLRLPAALRAAPDDWPVALETACTQSFGCQIPDFLTHWKALGQAFWWAESHHGFEFETGYVGQHTSLPILFAKILREEDRFISKEIAKVESLLKGYTASAQALEPSFRQADPENLCAQAWQIGMEAISLRAREYLIYLRTQTGHIEKEAAAEVLQSTQTLTDRWQTLLQEIYQPSGNLLIQMLVYGETKRLLPKIAWGRFDKVRLEKIPLPEKSPSS